MVFAICSTITGARPSEGSSSKMAQGLPISVRAMVSICCSPPDMCAPERVAHAGQIRKQPEQLLRRPFGRTRARRLSADLEVLHYAEIGEYAPLLGHVAQAEAGDLIGSSLLDAAAVEADLARQRPHQADQGFQRGGFARAVAAQQHHDFAALCRQAEVVKDMRAAVGAVDALHLKHARPQRRCPSPDTLPAPPDRRARRPACLRR